MTPGETIHVDCPLCGRDESEILFTRDGYRHVRCRECDLVYVNPRNSRIVESNAELFGRTHPAWSGISSEFREMSRSEREKMIDFMRNKPKKKYLRELAFAERYRRTGRLLDVGCAYGGFLLAAEGRAWKPSGVDVARENADLCREIFGLDVQCRTLEEAAFEDRSFDLAARRASQPRHDQHPEPHLLLSGQAMELPGQTRKRAHCFFYQKNARRGAR